jgi:hypothetical protein
MVHIFYNVTVPPIRFNAGSYLMQDNIPWQSDQPILTAAIFPAGIVFIFSKCIYSLTI